jgi:hypothetical protein
MGFLFYFNYLIRFKDMKNFSLFLLITAFLSIVSCEKDKESENFRNLTGTTWISDSLLVNGIDASGAGGLLENFKGDVIFNEDGTGTFGSYEGEWTFALNETQLIITSVSLPLPLTATIKELTGTSLKITTVFPNPQDMSSPLNIRMTFKPK